MNNDEYGQKNTDMLRENLLDINCYIFKNLKNFNIPLRDFLNEFERQILQHVLFLTNGNQKRAASLLGVKKSTFCEKVKRYRINPLGFNRCYVGFNIYYHSYNHKRIAKNPSKGQNFKDKSNILEESEDSAEMIAIILGDGNIFYKEGHKYLLRV